MEEAAEAQGGGEEEEQVMSEVHLGCPPRFSGTYLSHFTFFSQPLTPPPLEASPSQEDNGDTPKNSSLQRSMIHCGEGASTDSLAVDEDGDLVLDRRRNKNGTGVNYVLAIQHGITTSLGNVGLQVWRAALVLADFVLHGSFTSSELNGVTAMEIGAGTGLVGIALARVARTVFITDRSTEVLDNCTANVRLNSSMLKFHEAEVYVRELDWKVSWPPPVGTCDPSDPSSRHSWSTREIEEAEKATVLLAADVVYSDDLTDLFFDTMQKLMSHGAEKVLYLTLEKRYNFSLDELDVVANGHAHFRSFLKDEDECERLDDLPLPCFTGKQIDLASVPQYIREYERGKDLEMWKITYSPQRQN